MHRFVVALVATVLTGATLFANPAPPGESKETTFPYPDKAAAVVCLNGYDTFRERLTKMLAAGFPDDVALLTRVIDDQLNKLFEGRKLHGVRKDARVFLVIHDVRGILENKFTASVLIPVTSPKKFRETFLTKEEFRSLGRDKNGVHSFKTPAASGELTIHLADLDGYVAAGTDKAIVDGYAAKYVPGTTEHMGRELAETFLKADVAVYVNVEVVNEQMGDELRSFKKLFEWVLQQAVDQGKIPWINKKQLNAAKVMVRGVFQGIQDCRALVLCGEFRPQGLLLRLQARFVENSPTARLIQMETPGAIENFGKLPSGFTSYYESQVGESFRSVMVEMASEFIAAPDDLKGSSLLDEHLKARNAASPGTTFSAEMSPGTAIVVTHFKDPQKATQAITKAHQAIAAGGSIRVVMVKAAPIVTERAQQHRGFTFSEVRVHFDLEATAARLPDGPIREMFLLELKHKVLEKTGIWIGTDGKVVVQLTAKDWTSAKEILDKYLDGKKVVGSEEGFRLTREHLPAEASYVTFEETQAMITRYAGSFETVLQLIPGVPQVTPLNPVKSEPTYLGVALVLKGDNAGVTLFVPTKAMTVARKMMGASTKSDK